MDLKLAGQSVLITGASQGIGSGLAQAFAEEGVNMHLTARSADRLEELKRTIVEDHDVEVELHPLDLTEQGERHAFRDR
jgi:short-subunit dehydrogenase